jgi:hypothetical protein
VRSLIRLRRRLIRRATRVRNVAPETRCPSPTSSTSLLPQGSRARLLPDRSATRRSRPAARSPSTARLPAAPAPLPTALLRRNSRRSLLPIFPQKLPQLVLLPLNARMRFADASTDRAGVGVVGVGFLDGRRGGGEGGTGLRFFGNGRAGREGGVKKAVVGGGEGVGDFAGGRVGLGGEGGGDVVRKEGGNDLADLFRRRTVLLPLAHRDRSGLHRRILLTPC